MRRKFGQRLFRSVIYRVTAHAFTGIKVLYCSIFIHGISSFGKLKLRQFLATKRLYLSAVILWMYWWYQVIKGNTSRDPEAVDFPGWCASGNG